MIRGSGVIATILLVGCGGDGGTEPDPEPEPAVASVVVTPSDTTLVSIGETVAFSAQALAADGSSIHGQAVNWTSAEDGVATVSASGLATAVENGSTMVTATVSGVDGSATVTVQQAAASISLTPRDTTLTALGDSAQLVAEVLDGEGVSIENPSVSWTSLDVGVASVSSAGLVTAEGAGTAVIVGAADAVEDSAEITVTVQEDSGELAFLVQPHDVVAGGVITPAVEVEILNATGVRAIGDDTTIVQIALVDAAGGGATLTGTIARTSIAGVVAFDDLSVDGVGTGYRLEASADGFASATSDPFDVTSTLTDTASWINPAGGDWRVGSNWSTGVPPDTAQVAVISLDGTYTVVVDDHLDIGALSVGGGTGMQTLLADSVNMRIRGTVSILPSGHLLMYEDPAPGQVMSYADSVSGAGPFTNQGKLDLGHTTIGMAVLNEGVVLVRGSSEVAGLSTSSLSEIEIRRTDLEPATLSVSTGFANAGTILLSDTETGTAAGSRLLVNGMLVNTASGSISSGENVDAGIMAFDFDNQGDLVAGGVDFYLNQSGASYTNSGSISVDAGSLLVYLESAADTFDNSGVITVVDGDLVFSGTGPFLNGGLVETGSGHGLGGFDIINKTGGTVVGNGSLASSFGTVTNMGTLSPGFSIGRMGLLGNSELASDGVLAVEIAGTHPDSGFDRLEAAGGTVDVGGTLEVSLINGFTPAEGDSFPILTYTDRTGGFSDLVLPDLGTMSMDTTSTSGQTVDTMYLVVRGGASALSFYDVSLGNEFSCGITPAGAGYCWGVPDMSLGLGFLPSGPQSAPAPVTGGLVFDVVRAGSYHTCGIAGGGAFCWGAGTYGGLGNGSETFYYEPVAVQGDHEWTSIGAGFYESCGVDSAGQALVLGIQRLGASRRQHAG